MGGLRGLGCAGSITGHRHLAQEAAHLLQINRPIFSLLYAIRRNLMRSSLTVLGIVIGVAAVIIMVTLGNGATARVTSHISSLGANMLMVMPSQEGRGMGGGMRGEAKLFETADVDALRDEVPGVSFVAPTASKTMQVIYGNSNWFTSVNGHREPPGGRHRDHEHHAGVDDPPADHGMCGIVPEQVKTETDWLLPARR